MTELEKQRGHIWTAASNVKRLGRFWYGHGDLAVIVDPSLMGPNQEMMVDLTQIRTFDARPVL